MMYFHFLLVQSQGQPCYTNFTSFSGMIESPQYPIDSTVESHLTNESCSSSEWTITIPYPYANIIKLTYIEFDIHDNNCDGGDVLTVSVSLFKQFLNST